MVFDALSGRLVVVRCRAVAVTEAISGRQYRLSVTGPVVEDADCLRHLISEAAATMPIPSEKASATVGERRLASAISSKSSSLGHVEVHELDGLLSDWRRKLPEQGC